jgi:ankyrin repeat protein
MSEEKRAAVPASVSLPENPNLEWLRKQAKRKLAELRATNPAAKLAEAQFDLARLYGFLSWRALKAHVDSLTIDGQLIEAALRGDVDTLTALLDKHPEKLEMRVPPYDSMLLFPAAESGNVAAVDLLLKRGLDVSYREKGDNTYAMHWAAAAGHLEVVRRLADAGGDVVGHGDDHELEVIGWATCWAQGREPSSPEFARAAAVVDFLVSHGARHHIFSAMAMNLADEVRRIVAADPAQLNSRMSRNENHQMPLHFAVRNNLPEMVMLLLELGADPLAVDGSGQPAAVYAMAPGTDRSVMEKIRAMTAGELLSASRGNRPPRLGPTDLLAALAFGDWQSAERLLHANHSLIEPSGGVLHLMAKRGDVRAVKWLLEHGADASARWAHWDAEVTPLHLAVLGDHAEIVRVLLDAGADPSIRDSKHEADTMGWAEFFRREEIVRMLKERGADA